MISLWSGTVPTTAKLSASGTSLSEKMRADAQLPVDIAPGDADTVVRSAVLVTGATGFLGRIVIRELLARPYTEIVCLVRAANTLEARERLALSLGLAGIDFIAHAQRLLVVAAAVDHLQFGLSHDDYYQLADRVDHVYHCAADVNWTRSYQQLRPSNVTGTLEVIRFACTGHRKRVLYTSTIGVCFATDVPQSLDESRDMLPHIDHMPLPYAQTKCVSESMLRDASSRGLPVSVIRPALISGDSETGISNPDDLISALIQGCVTSGSAFDADWRLDCVPVDHVARVLVRIGETARPHWELFNLFNEHGRHWREVVLWMNLYGYPVKLLNHTEWLQRTFDRLRTRYSLFGYRRFFGATSVRNSGPAQYEFYLENNQSRVQNVRTQAALVELGIKVPAMDTNLLERYLVHYAEAGLVPRVSRACNGYRKIEGTDLLKSTMGRWLLSRDLRLGSASEESIKSHNGIFNEVASAKVGGTVGIRRFEIEFTDQNSNIAEALDVILKVKPSDVVMQDILVEVATLCDTQLGIHCETFKHDLGLAGCHERELALYERTELRRFMPRTYGTCHDSRQATWSIAMEYLKEADVPTVIGAGWNRENVTAVMSGLARLHATFYRSDCELNELPWLSTPPDTKRMLEMVPLWRALAEYSAPCFDVWLDEPILPVQKSLIDTLGHWWPELQSMPKTLVHNDCNPRNFVMRRSGNESAPVFFDWELATIDVAQRDVAELLCFILPAGSGHEDLAEWLDLHRRGMQEAAGIAVNPSDCLRGFILSLRYLMINRLPLYTLMHRFQPQTFLPTVIRNWHKLYLLGNTLSLADKARSGHSSHRSATEITWIV